MSWGRILLLAGCGLSSLEAQDPVFRTETNLALVRFHAVQKRRYLDDIKRADVLLLEDGQPREIALFEGGRTARRTVAVVLILLFDTSGSVVWEGLLSALAFKSNMLDPLENVRLAVYGFNSRLERSAAPRAIRPNWTVFSGA